MLLFVVTTALTVQVGGWIALVGALVGVWGIFMGCMAIYQIGQHVAYIQALKWAEEVREVIRDGHVELAKAMSQIDALARHLDPEQRRFEGPS